MIKLKRVLCPTDFSEFSHKSVHYGCELAGAFGATASAHSWVVWASWRDCCLYGIPLLEFVCVSLLVV